MDKIDLSEESLRKRLYQIAAEIGDGELKEASLVDFLEPLIMRVICSGNVELIVREFFIGFPNYETIVRSILRYRHEPNAMGAVMYGVGKTIVYTADPEAVRRVAEFANNFDGEGLEKIMFVVGKTADSTINGEAVKGVVEVAERHKEAEWEDAMNEILKTATSSLDAAAVIRCANKYL